METRGDTYDVSLGVVLVLDNENHVKSRKNGWHEVDVVLSLRVVPATKDGIGGGQDRAPGVESCCYARLESIDTFII